MQKNKILIVDDEADLCQILQFNFEQNGFVADTTNSGEDALKKDLESYNIFLFDIMMEGINGFELLKHIRQKRKLTTPIIFITALTNEDSVLQGFNIGADDYIKKPFSVKEVVARTNAVLKRSGNWTADNKKYGTIKIDSTKKLIVINNEPINFTKTEYDIFTLLYNNPEKVYSRKEILKQIWINEYVSGRTIDVNITRIRKKLNKIGDCIATRSGYGYYFNPNIVAD